MTTNRYDQRRTMTTFLLATCAYMHGESVQPVNACLWRYGVNRGRWYKCEVLSAGWWWTMVMTVVQKQDV